MRRELALAALVALAMLPPPSPAQPAGAGDEAAAGRAPVRYRPVRDPFRPFVLEYGTEAVEHATPLQRYELSQLKVAAVIVGLDQPAAMVEDANGMGYVVTPGTPIGVRGGVVTEILPDGLVVEEKTRDFYDRVQVVRRVLRIAGGEEGGEAPGGEGAVAGPQPGGGPTEGAETEGSEGSDEALQE